VDCLGSTHLMHDVVPPPSLAGTPAELAQRKRRHPVRVGLAARTIILITAFIFLAETMIYLPLVATFRDSWLRNRLSAGYTAALVLEAAPRAMVPEALSRELLESVGARIIVLQMHGARRILAASELPLEVDETYDLRDADILTSFAAAIRALTSPKGRVLTIIGDAPRGGEAIEVTMDEAPLKQALRDYSQRILIISLTLSAIVASLAAIATHIMVLGPVRRLTRSLMNFSEDPEDHSRIIVPSGQRHEIGCAEEKLAMMQSTLARELNQKKHLAALGLAVAKINHDMRNMLAPAQLLSDRLADVPDPLAQRLAPKLVATLDRAIRFCQATLTYGRAVDDPPKPSPVALRTIVTEAAETVTQAVQGRIEVVTEVPEDFEIVADAEQIFRVLMNLIRNGAEALEAAGPAPGYSPQVIIRARREKQSAVIEIADTGPGVPQAVRARLFTAVFSSSRPGGSGLGLAIAADLVHAHGGTIILVPEAEAESPGATFRITLPASPVKLRSV